MSLHTTTTLSVEDICTQRKKKQQLFLPKNRFEKISPYDGTYTQFDFDMRRKAETLKYERTDTKMGKKTQRSLWSNVVQTRAAQPKNRKVAYNKRDNRYDTYVYNNAVDICDASAAPAPSSNSDVPGDINLYLDHNVPLYNYKISRDYGILFPSPVFNVYAQTTKDTSMSYTSYTNAMTIYPLDTPTSTTQINLSIPVSFYITGTANKPSIFTGIDVSLTSISYRIMFNDSIVSTGTTTLPDVHDIVFDSTLNTNDQIHGDLYLGTIDIFDLTVNSTADYVFDVVYQPMFTNFPPITVTENIDSLDYGIKAHPTETTTVTNLTFNTSASTDSSSVIIESYSQGEEIVSIFRYREDILATTTPTAPIVPPTAPVAPRILSEHVFVSVVKYNNLPRYELRNTTLRNGIYYVDDSSYNPALTYIVNDGSYYFVNIPTAYPMTILNAWAPLTLWKNNNDVGYDYGGTYSEYDITTYQETEEITTLDPSQNGTYNFIYESAILDICGNYSDVSGISLYNNVIGFMGGEHVLYYS